jgi:hypothetical protein
MMDFGGRTVDQYVMNWAPRASQCFVSFGAVSLAADDVRRMDGRELSDHVNDLSMSASSARHCDRLSSSASGA